MNARFYDLEWIPGESFGETGVKGGKIPKGAVRGSHGTFIVATSAKLILTLKCENGEFIEKDIYQDVKDVTDIKIAKGLRKKIQDKFENTLFLIKNGEIINLYDAIKDSVR